jgi:glycine cleavage system H protein
MAEVHGCDFPDGLYYQLEDNVWARLENDGCLVVGMTAYACSLSGQIVAFTPKKPGRFVETGRSLATVESGKWVGPVKAPVAGEIVAVNEALHDDPGLINADPYGAGWMVRLKPADWATESTRLVSGTAVVPAFEAKMHEDGFGAF